MSVRPRLALVAVAAAVRHPTAPDIETPVAGQQEPLTLARSTWLVLSFVAAAASLLVFPRPPWYLAVPLAAIGVATGVNLFATIRERERLLVVERTLRLSLAEVLRADKPGAIFERAAIAADRLLGHKSLVEVELLRWDGANWVSCPDGHVVGVGADFEPRLLECRRTGRVFRRESRSALPGVGYVTTLALPLRRGGEEVDLLLIEVAPVLNTVEIEQIRQSPGPSIGPSSPTS